jgi:NADP-dependent alcohol dehydrogenase
VIERLWTDIRSSPADRDAAGSAPRPAIVAIGGGSVIDAAKLLRLRLFSPSVFQAARHGASLHGVSLLPPHSVHDVPRLTAIPTTLGTGAEASAVACVQGAGGIGARRLVVGDALRPDAVVLDARLTRSLHSDAVREGAAEILLRLLGAYVGSVPKDVPDRAAEALVARVSVLAAHGIRHGFDDAVREGLAVASAETHGGWALVGRAPFAAKHWYLANELSSTARLPKVPVTLALLPAVWSRILDGDDRLGSAERLRALWRVVAEHLSLPVDPVNGALAWLDRWGLGSVRVPRAAVIVAARSCARMWGGPRPALHGLSEAEVLEIYATALGVEPAAAHADGEGVNR